MLDGIDDNTLISIIGLVIGGLVSVAIAKINGLHKIANSRLTTALEKIVTLETLVREMKETRTILRQETQDE